MNKHLTKPEPSFEVIAKAERFLNRVLAYQAAIAVHQLKEDLDLDTEELTLSVSPVSPEVPGVYRVICTIVRASEPEPVVLEVVIEPEKAVARKTEVGERNRPTARGNGARRDENA